MITNLENKKIVIIGAGLTGISCVDFFISRGIIPRVMDDKLCLSDLKQFPDNVEFWSGELNEQWLLEASIIIVSPGVSLSHPALVKAKIKGIKIIGDIELFAQEATAPIVAITGSNGKSTVTNLVSKMAIYAGLQVGVGGNIGLPALRLLKQSYDFYILELSSFQLESTYSLRAEAAALLNISEDHMDRYPFGLQQYRTAKLMVYRNANVCVINSEDPLTFPVNKKNVRYISFGVHTGEYHIAQLSGKKWFMFHNEPLLACDELKITGLHNYNNALAALALADAICIPRLACLSALREFAPLSHRFELSYERNNIRWINDSKSTNIGSTEAAINSLKIDGTIHLLIGGDGKSANFNLLAKKVKKNNIRLYCFGKDGLELMKLNTDNSELTETMEQAMHLIKKRIKPGDTVLLSPACSSLDQFKNFEERGICFSKLARKIG